jgi:hypothetical protein
LTTLAFGAAAAPKDAAATAKIDEAINVHYLATDFAKAEGQLLGVVKACGKDGCSPQIIGRAWMYVGLVRGSGKQDLAGAREAFGKAKGADAGVALDTALATPEVQAEFEAVGGGSPTPPPAAPSGGSDTAAMLAAAAGSEAGECTPAADSEIEIRRPIPMSCKAPEGVTKGILAFKEFGGTQFVNVPMSLQNGYLRAPIPCSATKMEGSLQYVVVMKDGSGATVNSVGSLDEPAQLKIVKATTQSPPAYPGEAPPARCAEEVECPPGMPGCTPAGGGGWGDSCTPAEPCKKGLYCNAGACENSPSCETDSDCDNGTCADGFCQVEDSSSGSSSAGKQFRRVWIGLHGAGDIHFFNKSNDVCGATSIGNSKYSCFYSGKQMPLRNDRTDFPGIPSDGSAGRINGGAKLATLRILASIDYAFTEHLSLGARLGFAFNGGPQGAKYSQAQPGAPIEVAAGKKFMPFHGELRGTWWIRSLAKDGIKPYISAGGGVAQVDAKMKVPVRLCTNVTNSVCTASTDYYADAYKRLGLGFANVALGAMFPVTDRIGIVPNVNFMYMLPTSGFVIEPSLGMMMGF